MKLQHLLLAALAGAAAAAPASSKKTSTTKPGFCFVSTVTSAVNKVNSMTSATSFCSSYLQIPNKSTVIDATVLSRRTITKTITVNSAKHTVTHNPVTIPITLTSGLDTSTRTITITVTSGAGSSTTSGAVVTLGSTTATAVETGGTIVLDGVTLTPGQIATIAGNVVSDASTAIVVAGVTVPFSKLSGLVPTVTSAIGAVVTLGGEIFSAVNSAGTVVLDGVTLTAGAKSTINGVLVSDATTGLVVAGKTIPFSALTALPTLTGSGLGAVVSIGSATVTASASAGTVVLDGITLSPGQVTTILGKVVSDVSTALVVAGNTIPFSSIPTSTTGSGLGAVVSIGSATITATESAGTVAVAGITLSAGQAASILGQVVSDVGSALVVAGKTIPISNIPTSTSGSGSGLGAVVSIGSATITASASSGTVAVAGITLTPGQVATIGGQIVSDASSALVVAGKTLPFSLLGGASTTVTVTAGPTSTTSITLPASDIITVSAGVSNIVTVTAGIGNGVTVSVGASGTVTATAGLATVTNTAPLVTVNAGQLLTVTAALTQTSLLCVSAHAKRDAAHIFAPHPIEERAATTTTLPSAVKTMSKALLSSACSCIAYIHTPYSTATLTVIKTTTVTDTKTATTGGALQTTTITPHITNTIISHTGTKTVTAHVTVTVGANGGIDKRALVSVNSLLGLTATVTVAPIATVIIGPTSTVTQGGSTVTVTLSGTTVTVPTLTITATVPTLSTTVTPTTTVSGTSTTTVAPACTPTCTSVSGASGNPFTLNFAGADVTANTGTLLSGLLGGAVTTTLAQGLDVCAAVNACANRAVVDGQPSFEVYFDAVANAYVCVELPVTTPLTSAVFNVVNPNAPIALGFNQL